VDPRAGLDDVEKRKFLTPRGMTGKERDINGKEIGYKETKEKG
jgi:hypothetical protein